jgi:AraC-like DNA-binding protein
MDEVMASSLGGCGGDGLNKRDIRRTLTGVKNWLERTSGILHPSGAAKSFRLLRYRPSKDLAPFVARFWILRWTLREPYRQDVIPYPCVNLAVERGRSGIFGVPSKNVSRVIEGEGLVFGVKFLPGGFRTFFGKPIAGLTDRSVPIADVFGTADREWEEAILSLNEDAPMIAQAESRLRAQNPERHPDAETALQIVNAIADDREITRVDDLVRLAGASKRTLERLFREYVGVGPKWVIQRYRLHEAAELAASSQTRDWADLAARLGYADQAHFIRDFKRFVGQSPSRYAAMAATGADA